MPMPNRGATIALWAVRILLALLFVATGIFKFVGPSALVKEYAEIGLGQWFRYATGVLELIGAGLLLTTRFTAVGAVLLICICGGAFVAQVAVLHGDAIHLVVMAVPLAIVLWFTKDQLLGRSDPRQFQDSRHDR